MSPKKPHTYSKQAEVYKHGDSLNNHLQNPVIVYSYNGKCM